MSSHSVETVPRAPLFALAGLVIVCVLAVAAVRLTGVGVVASPPDRPVQIRELHFQDLPDGRVLVTDAPSGDTLLVVETGTQGFLRSTVRGFARERKRSGIGAEAPFQLVGHADGRLTLDDPQTGRRVDLGSFGPTNAAVFSGLMKGLPLRPSPTETPSRRIP